ncbi:hypothetical protein [Streptomyces smaragdinus]|uniref:hypothetical protein n=1 Tax=Streptomyces smaragdinus TaxID=2585196 RepID=UPI0012976235|nr:hypothetical protein [Streptomyces smaragdinus]
MDPFERLIGALEEAGLWRGLSSDRASEIVRGLVSGLDMTWPSGGAWRADGEDLAEGEVEEWLAGMVGSLGDCGVSLVVETRSGPYDERLDSYRVAVNGKGLDLYFVDPAERSLPLALDPWMDCTVVPAAEVNRLLGEVGSERRVGVFWPGGNDGFSVLGPEGVLREAAAGIVAVDGASAFVVP